MGSAAIVSIGKLAIRYASSANALNLKRCEIPNDSSSKLTILTFVFVHFANFVFFVKYLDYDFVIILQKTTASIAAKRDGAQLRQAINESDASEILRRVSCEEADKVWYLVFLNAG